MYIYLLIQTLQCEQKQLIQENICKRDPLEIPRPKFENSRLESVLQAFNSPVNQLLLCPKWLWCHYKCHSSLMLDNSHVRHSILAVFFLYISCCIFLVLLIIDFVSSASLVLYSIIITLLGEERADLYVVVYQWACILVCFHFCVCPFGATVICSMMFTLHRRHCSFITDKALTHIWYTNLTIYENKEAR